MLRMSADQVADPSGKPELPITRGLRLSFLAGGAVTAVVEQVDGGGVYELPRESWSAARARYR